MATSTAAARKLVEEVPSFACAAKAKTTVKTVKKTARRAAKG